MQDLPEEDEADEMLGADGEAESLDDDDEWATDFDDDDEDPDLSLREIYRRSSGHW